MPKQTFLNLPAEKRLRFLDVAIQEFANHSFEVASISDIVRKVGIAKGSFYQYFEDKQDLFRYLVEKAIAEKQKLMDQLPPADINDDLFGYLRFLFKMEVIFEQREPQLARIALRAFMEDVPFSDMKAELRSRGTTQFFQQLLTQGLVQGKVDPYIDANLAAFVLETIYYQLGRYFLARLQTADVETATEAIFDHPEAEHLLDNLMDILQSGLSSRRSHPSG